MDEAYKMACTEVTEALKYIPLEEYHKIPGKVLKFIKDNCDSKYNYKYDVKNPKLSKRANIIITKLYLDYIADEKEKRIINEILILNSRKKQNSYTTDVFGNEKENNNRTSQAKNEQHNLPIETENTSWIKRLINKIKLIFVGRKS